MMHKTVFEFFEIIMGKRRPAIFLPPQSDGDLFSQKNIFVSCFRMFRIFKLFHVYYTVH
jgi:hypothetical protein